MNDAPVGMHVKYCIGISSLTLQREGRLGNEEQNGEKINSCNSFTGAGTVRITGVWECGSKGGSW